MANARELFPGRGGRRGKGGVRIVGRTAWHRDLRIARRQPGRLRTTKHNPPDSVLAVLHRALNAVGQARNRLDKSEQGGQRSLALSLLNGGCHADWTADLLEG